MSMSFTWPSRLVRVFVILASLTSRSVSEATSAGNRGRSSRFVNVVEELIHPPASRWLQRDKSGINIPLEKLRAADMDQPDVRSATPSIDKQSPEVTGRSPGRRSLNNYHYHARELSQSSPRTPPRSERPPNRHASVPPPPRLHF